MQTDEELAVEKAKQLSIAAEASVALATEGPARFGCWSDQAREEARMSTICRRRRAHGR